MTGLSFIKGINSNALYVFATVTYKCHLNVLFTSDIMVLIEL